MARQLILNRGKAEMVSKIKIGTGQFTYEVAVGWEKLPPATPGATRPR